MHTVAHRPGEFFHPINIWHSTLPNSEGEVYEWSVCSGCPFEVLQEVSPGGTYGGGMAEVLHNLELISAQYEWRVTAIYSDGTELTSETWSFSVYAFYPVTVEGTVTDAVTGGAVEGVHLSLRSGPADWGRWTDGGGTFSFINGPGGPEPPSLTVAKDGYQTQTLDLAVGESVVLSIQLQPSG